ncbi:Grx4 family monothiol glutaredoxin [Gammaproteobacteria bacterium]|nr:Grx4 family monothiol glutaredoxin [Gammaproteobacteria bacterium]
MPMEIQEQIRSAVTENEVLLFMKGSPDFPQCGFSGRASQILKSFGVPFASIDVLSDESIRQGIKTFSDWPTIPQLYVRGEFVGGSDIMMELFESGELETLVKGEAA